ncbi:MAG: hypothetical protein K2O65_00965 [Lachnospiraceae bacterium]|nr:hypothetical protein [Lachnospiraceae bacterium]
MDKYEYKIRSDEIKSLIAEGEFAEAVSIADTIDWRRVKSVMMLCTISDLYKINRRYQESKEILLLAYERHPSSRSIVYSLCELSIKLEEYVQAIEYYKEFAQIAPKDTGRYILQYRLYEAQDVSLEERIAVLEEFKRRDPREKWEYELAYLYHRIGLSTKCIEICDEMFFMFGEGKYVIKALELKALHEPLSADQQAKYDAWIRERNGVDLPEDEPDEEDEDMDDVPGDTRVAGKIRHPEEEEGGDVSAAPTMELPEVKTVDVGQYNTINLQMALAESMKEILEDNGAQAEPEEEVPVPVQVSESDDAESAEDIEIEETETEETETEDVEVEETENENIEIESTDIEGIEEAEATEDTEDEETAEITEDTELSEMIEDTAEQENSEAEEAEEAEEADSKQDPIAETLIAPLLEETVEMPAPEEIEEQMRETPVIVFPKQTGAAADEPIMEKTTTDPEPKEMTMDTDDLREIGAQIAQEDTAAFDAQQILEQMRKPSKYDSLLSQEYDGQISLVVPEAERVEKQITGQLSIEDIMAEWEEMKKTTKQKQMEEVRQRILAHTGNIFADFDEATKNGLLEELERAFVAAIMKDSDKKPAIKKVINPEDVAVEVPAPKKLTPEMEKIVEAAVKDSEEELLAAEVEDEVEELEEIEESEPEEVQEQEETPEEPQTQTETTLTEHEPAEEVRQDRDLTEEEAELFAQFVHHRRSKKQLIHTLDNMSLASCTGNVVITGEEEAAALTLATDLIKEMQYNDNNFSGKVAKISGTVLNKKDVAETFARLDNGALIIEKASRLKSSTIIKMNKFLERDNTGLLLLMVDKKQNMNKLFDENAVLHNNFNLRVDIEPLDNEALVAYAKQYAEELEYSIDEFGILALHTRIADRQTSDHEVSMSEVRELVDEAISYANKKTPKHFMDILLAKRYDDEDMIILREKDFMHY